MQHQENNDQIEKDINDLNEQLQEEVSGTEQNITENQQDNNGTEALKAELAEVRDKYLRLFAEFDNFKKRTARERVDLIQTAAKDTLSAILPVLDDFDRAKQIIDKSEAKDPVSEGMLLAYNKLYAILKSRGLNEIESNGMAFDPEMHEAITEIPAPDDSLKGKVIDTIEKGYKLYDKLIRHAKVVVGN